MAITQILTARQLHGARTPDEYEAKHQQAVAKLRRHGWPVEISDGGKVDARVNHGRLVASCECGNVAIVSDPDWPGKPVARCFACGAVLKVTMPRSWKAIREVLLERPMPNRNWRSGESVAELRSDNTRRL